ncbi:chromosome segregation protein SMC [Clostridium sp. chh4-2]|uniref:ATP-binding protein n=1 Tax=Clostridium sp. chh4-2 TaxID=2067550 RepID=UPI000CCDDAB3|nr:SbcC/MukB-like Walker B domain-containing protein [Clostridium sp. chh4-2]PNV63395.1 chromosome segregation protein SMC [Clostridium sp. chh4-2]
MTNQRFEALSRMCLNNWHYISKKTLSFSDSINFFTGHSGSGKSTVLDALQIVLYANTDGRGFFNKAAADDSDRSLLEYLRGMITIGENNEFSYLRNKNFSSTIVLELKRTDTEEYQCVGVVFDVEVASNEISRLFFWHKGPLPDHQYRSGSRCMSIEEIKGYLQQNFNKEEYYYGSHNERFRRQLYDVYLGGLDMEKFPLLFKRAIPFRMNIKLEDFVKEYICTEQDIHIEDMQESVMMYGRMQKKIDDTCREIENLEQLHEIYQKMEAKEEEKRENQYLSDKMDILSVRQKIKELHDRIMLSTEDLDKQREMRDELERTVQELGVKSEQLLKQISSTGYDEKKSELRSLNELIEALLKSRVKWEKTAEGLNAWIDQDITDNSTIWDIEKFADGSIQADEIVRLKKSIQETRAEVKEQEQEASAAIRSLRKQEKAAQEDLKKLKQGKKAYPKELERACLYIQRRLLEETGKSVEVKILADLLDIRDDKWRNAVEGYMGNNKLALIVEPKYARKAMDIYQELDRKEYYRVAVLDTEKVSQKEHAVFTGSLSEEVITRNDYVQSYINFLLGKVVKCENTDELRKCQIGITADCVLYHSYRLQYINPDNYTRSAYIGAMSMAKRIRQLEQELEELKEELAPELKIQRECQEILNLEELGLPAEDYISWLSDMEKLKSREKEKKRLVKQLEELKEKKVDLWETERRGVLEEKKAKEDLAEQVKQVIWRLNEQMEENRRKQIELNELLVEKERNFTEDGRYERKADEFLQSQAEPRYDRLCQRFQDAALKADEERAGIYSELQESRFRYLKQYPNRSFSATIEDNEPYDKLLGRLQCDNLEEYRQIAREQARSAVEHFRDDFMFKIRSAIKEALIRKDELNRIINKLDFGKDKYQFVIGKNKGPDGRFYDMFMDDSLEVNPAMLTDSFEDQLNFFTINHENNYGDMINELINVFIPPENADHDQLEEAKQNMDKYADYRTYLSFDMQQIVRSQGEETIKIQLSKMIKKNSGGEGQNPLYVALLASFAQAYRINMSPKMLRNPTIRLVVLDEAFSKMDAEKVASCIELIRGLGFQAIISATNDKIQNYLENVDKTFVFANPNKKSISIQEFERKEFGELLRDLDGEDEQESLLIK